jgi:hypothetical protein
MRTLVLSVLFLSFSLTASAGNWVAEIYAKGAELNQSLEASGEVGYILNPIYCLDADRDEIVLIYSHDFRHRDGAYLINGNTATKVSTSSLNLKEESKDYYDGFLGSFVTLGNRTLVCAENAMQLESVPRR